MVSNAGRKCAGNAGAECVDPGCNCVHQWVRHAGPRLEIYFNPNEVKEAIVTCGGLFPGLNDVIRHIYTLWKISLVFPMDIVDFLMNTSLN
jgi:hypothetical protein